MKDDNNEFDWFKWADIKPTSLDNLMKEAEKYKVPVYPNDNEDVIFNRILAVKTYRNNKETIRINKSLAAISFVSAIVSIFMVFL